MVRANMKLAKSSSKIKQVAGIPTLSLFSGAGGLDLGFLQAGFDIKACVEIDPTYCRTLAANVGGQKGYKSGTTIHCEDIRKFDAKPFLNLSIECVIGGPPCQTFSAAGRRSGGVIGTEDERGQLFIAYCRILDELNPKVFVFENVYGLPGANQGKSWAEISLAFRSRGYNLHAEVVDAADYGTPQHRERLIVVGCKQGHFTFPIPTHGPDSENGEPLISVETAISDLQDPLEPFHNNLGGLYGDLLQRVPEGLNYSFFTAEMGYPEPVFAWRSKFHDFLYKADRGSPCRTLKAQPGKFTGPFHWKNRHFTLAELKRLQTFPDNYELVGGYGKALEQIGNSVPPRLAFVIATSVREQLLEKTNILSYSLRPAHFRSTFRQRQRSRNLKFHEVAKKAIATRYGNTKERGDLVFQKSPEKYHFTPTSLFDRKRVPRKTSKLDARQFGVKTKELGRQIQMEIWVDGIDYDSISTVEISGLAKYLPAFDSIKLNAKISDPADVFHAWGVIEDALVSRSRFFTLIDIYGHYANRGDTVRVKCDWRLDIDKDTLRVLNYFNRTENCGDFHMQNKVLEELGLNIGQFTGIVERLRSVRFDLRTPKTHPIIGEGRILCTYPFPLLSSRALVESRVKFVPSVENLEELFVAAS
jgi:DNA (cytosine-5)-methyltransferase 1